LPFCYGIAALSLSKIHIKEGPQCQLHRSVWEEIANGMQILKKHPTIRNAMINLVFLYSLLAALYVLTISLASSIESLGPTRFGTLLATSGLGMAIGAIFIAQTGHYFNRRKLAASGLGFITWSLILLGQLQGSLGFTLILCGVLGVGAALVAIPAQTTLQEDTPQSQRGKIFGLQNNFINISLSLPLVVAGTLVSRYGLLPVLWLLAGLAFIAAILEFPWKR